MGDDGVIEEEFPFDPRPDLWEFVNYYKFTFTFRSVEHPEWQASYGGDRDQIYRYSVVARPMPWADVTEHTCETDQDLHRVYGRLHDFVWIGKAGE